MRMVAYLPWLCKPCKVFSSWPHESLCPYGSFYFFPYPFSPIIVKLSLFRLHFAVKHGNLLLGRSFATVSFSAQQERVCVPARHRSLFSLPLSILLANVLLKCSMLPRSPGFRNASCDHSSIVLFSIGVPVSTNAAWFQSKNAFEFFDNGFFMLCDSSRTM